MAGHGHDSCRTAMVVAMAMATHGSQAVRPSQASQASQAARSLPLSGGGDTHSLIISLHCSPSHCVVDCIVSHRIEESHQGPEKVFLGRSMVDCWARYGALSACHVFPAHLPPSLAQRLPLGTHLPAQVP